MQVENVKLLSLSKIAWFGKMYSSHASGMYLALCSKHGAHFKWVLPQPTYAFSRLSVVSSLSINKGQNWCQTDQPNKCS